VQVADRFHLWANLGEAVEKTVIAHRDCLPEPTPVGEQRDVMPTAPVLPDQIRDAVGEQRQLNPGRRERYTAIQTLVTAGNSLNAVSRQTGLCFRTVQRYAQSAATETGHAQTSQGGQMAHDQPGQSADGDEVRLKQIMARCPELQATRRHVAGFAAMMREPRGDQLPTWTAPHPCCR